MSQNIWYEIWGQISDGTITIDSADKLQEAACILKREKRRFPNRDMGIDKWRRGKASNIKIADIPDKKILSLMKSCR
ncbi:hypothetical protein KKE60_08195 [Patescibacteria group bacterium]|nr:hypothetical protein [Patescibacteria group bacterium]